MICILAELLDDKPDEFLTDLQALLEEKLQHKQVVYSEEDPRQVAVIIES